MVWTTFLATAPAPVPLGVEALMILRLEKGYLHVGGDTDGTSTPDDLGWGPVAAKKSNEFLGQRSLSRPANRQPGRLQPWQPPARRTHCM